MLLSTKEKLQDLIVHILAGHAGLSADSIFRRLEHSRHYFSIQGVYKELRMLQEKGVVVKAKNLYSLKMTWILNVSHFADKIYDIYLERPSSEDLLPPGRTKSIWKFSNLLKLDDFYVHLMTTIYHGLKNKTVFTWLDHPWFLLQHSDKEIEYQNTLRHEEKRQYIIIEGDSPLDRQCVKIYDPKIFTYSHAPSSLSDEKSTIYTVFDHLILSAHLAKDTKKEVARLFERVPSIKDLDLRELLRLFSRPITGAVVLEKNLKKAQRLRKKFTEYFGITKI